MLSKKYLKVVFIFLFMLFGCGGGNDNPDKPNVPTGPSTPGDSEEPDNPVIPDVKEPVLVIKTKAITVYVGEEAIIDFEIVNSNSDCKVQFEAKDSGIVTINENKVTAEKEGKTTIYGYLESNASVKTEINVEVKKLVATEIIIEGDTTVYINHTIQLIASVYPESLTNKTVTWSSSNERVATVDENGVVMGIASGKAIITATSTDGSGVSASYNIVSEKDRVKPEIIIDESVTSQDVELSYNNEFDPLLGIKAIDNLDGDLTSKIVVAGVVDSRVFKTYRITYTVTDSNRNKAELVRKVTIIWDYAVNFIGHAGCYSGLMNSAEAFENAINLHGYRLVECDVKQTKDGVFVVSHDDTFNGFSLTSKTWEEWQKVTYTASRGGVSYTTKLCSFEEYLNICRRGNAIAVVELKSSSGITNSDQSRMGALMEVIKKCKMLDRVIFLGSQYKCLEWVRNNGYDIPCQYLVNSIASQSTLDYCVEHNFDISFNISYESNTKDWIDMYHEAGLLVSSWTFSQYTTPKDLQHWIDMGVDFVTVDKMLPYEVNLPR